VSDAHEITRRAKSNLALALKILPKDRREDMETFYAFCRTMDDLADEPGRPTEERSAALNHWHHGITDGFHSPNELQTALIDLKERCQIPNELLLAIIDGCKSDLHPQRFASCQALEDYIWKVACAVGLVSIRLFGCTSKDSELYAVALGKALQLTNILRDIREDYANDKRIYLPLDDLDRFGYTETDLANQTHDGRFLALMNFQANRAEAWFREAESALPASDHKALRPARIMAEIYQRLLETMRSDNFHVFTQRYRVSAARKLMILAKHMAD
jgi:phytoene synthase